MISRLLTFGALVLAICGSALAQAGRPDDYDVVLHSVSVEGQRSALTAVLRNPQVYVPRIRQSLQNYPVLLRTDKVAANRAVYVAALVRDPSFAPILVGMLRDPDVLSECEYACPVVFALTIDACFAGWSPPSRLDSTLSTVSDLLTQIHLVPRIDLQPKPIEDVVSGPGLERHRKEIEGKTEEQLIRLAGPSTVSDETRLFAVFRLETSVSTGKNLIDLYLLAMNDIRNDASGEYRSAIYESIYRAELAKQRAKSR